MSLADLRQWHVDQAARANANARYWTEGRWPDALKTELAQPFLDLAAFHVDAATLLDGEAGL